MTCAPAVAHRAAVQLRRRAIPVITAALMVAASAAVVSPTPAQAAYAPRVVIVVGPSHANTRDYLSHARDYARQAKAYGATVITVFHPHATWDRVVAAAQGANILIYLGHGNGWPSPYSPFQGRTKNGLGLNPTDGAGPRRVAYYGEDAIRAQIRLAPGAIVLLNRLCYASGDGEPGSRQPSWRTAIKRVDNFAAGFLDAGASAVLADGHTSLDPELRWIFARDRSLLELWRSDPDANGHVRAFPSARSPGAIVRLDPDRANAGFFRSLVTRGGPTTAAIRIAAYWGRTRDRSSIRTSPGGRIVAWLPDGSRYVVRGALVADDAGRTWAPVMTQSGRSGYVAAWGQAFSGTARPRTSVVLRSGPSTSARRIRVVKAGTRLVVLRSRQDRANRAWLQVRMPSGRTGWIAAWLTVP